MPDKEKGLKHVKVFQLRKKGEAAWGCNLQVKPDATLDDYADVIQPDEEARIIKQFSDVVVESTENPINLMGTDSKLINPHSEEDQGGHASKPVKPHPSETIAKPRTNEAIEQFMRLEHEMEQARNPQTTNE